MHDISYYLHVIIDFFRDDFRQGFAHVNAVLGIVIAVFATYLMPAWRRIWAVALGATIIHLIAKVTLPVLADKAPFRLPPNLLEPSYWRAAVALYLGYLLVIAIFFVIKKRFLPKGGRKH